MMHQVMKKSSTSNSQRDRVTAAEATTLRLKPKSQTCFQSNAESMKQTSLATPVESDVQRKPAQSKTNSTSTATASIFSSTETIVSEYDRTCQDVQSRVIDLTEYFSAEAVDKMSTVEQNMYRNQVQVYWMLKELGMLPYIVDCWSHIADS